MKFPVVVSIFASIPFAFGGPSSTAPADWKKLGPAEKPQGAPPKITIVSPKPDEERVGLETKSADNKYEALECLQDAKTFGIKLTAEHWNVAPGGNGVLVIVDGVYATNTHDLSKPVMVADLEPYERTPMANSSTFAVEYPMYACEEHWVAAIPTDAHGQMLDMEPTVTWWRNVRSNGNTLAEDPERRKARLERGLPIINWPLLGSHYVGATWNFLIDLDEGQHLSGRVLADPKHPSFDWRIARQSGKDACEFKLSRADGEGQRSNDTPLGMHGAVVLPPAFVDGVMILDMDGCGQMTYAAGLWSKTPAGPKKTLVWPKPGSAVAEDYWSSPEGQAALKDASHPRTSGAGCVLDRDCQSKTCISRGPKHSGYCK